MSILIFKNIGKFSDEASSRYEAIINENLKVDIWKDAYVFKGFRFSFKTMKGYSISDFNDHLLAYFYKNATKKDVITYLEKVINEYPSLIEDITKKSISMDK